MEIYLTKNMARPDSHTLRAYLEAGGYAGLKKALTEMAPEEVTQEVKKSGLRGRGGAGFPTGLKWSFMPKQSPEPRYLVVNADESEPGTFKDRLIMERDPHLLLEGIAIAAYAMGANEAWIYIRGEFAFLEPKLEQAIREAYQQGFLGPKILGTTFGLEVRIYRGAGAYICGEETGLLESLEGKKGMPRKKPPYPAQYGAWGCPTTVNNVETLANVPHIILRGADWFRSMGTEKSPGNLLFGVSGHVNRPGIYELPLGTPLREIIYEHAGGLPGGRVLKAIIPGGSSCPMISGREVDVPMDYESLREVNSLLGTGAVIVMDETTCIPRVTWRIARFYRDESCGQCTQCREGTAWLDMILRSIEDGRGRPDDLDLLWELAEQMEARTICALADAAAWPVYGALRHFRHEFEEHVRLGRCPFKEVEAAVSGAV